MTKYLTAMAALLFLGGCLVKPPPGDDLGPAISMDSINNALIQAQTGVDPVKGFQVGDTGSVLSTVATVSTTEVLETDIYTITAADATTITVTDTVTQVGTIGATTTTSRFYRPGMEPTASPTPAPTPTPSASPAANLESDVYPSRVTRFIAGLFSDTFSYLNKWLSRISIQPSTAVGEVESLPKSLRPGSARGLRQPGLWTLNSERQIRGNALSNIKQRDPAPVPLPSPSPSPGPAEPTVTSDQYYRLIVNPDTFLTQNCAQIANCTVNSTNVQFEEVLTTSAGQTIRLHWSYEFSTKVPGLFTLMDRCWTQIENINTVQTPVTECDNDLSDFRWANPPTD